MTDLPRKPRRGLPILSFARSIVNQRAAQDRPSGSRGALVRGPRIIEHPKGPRRPGEIFTRRRRFFVNPEHPVGKAVRRRQGPAAKPRPPGLAIWGCGLHSADVQAGGRFLSALG